MPTTCTSPTLKSVSFDKVTIRSYPLELGGGICSNGPPLTIGWELLHEASVTLLEFERKHSLPRERFELKLSGKTRYRILRNAGYTNDEIRLASDEVSKTRKQREQTASKPNAFGKLEEFAESATRTVKKAARIRTFTNHAA
jgi:hypothetical protein